MEPVVVWKEKTNWNDDNWNKGKSVRNIFSLREFEHKFIVWEYNRKYLIVNLTGL